MTTIKTTRRRATVRPRMKSSHEKVLDGGAAQEKTRAPRGVRAQRRRVAAAAARLALREPTPSRVTARAA